MKRVKNILFTSIAVCFSLLVLSTNGLAQTKKKVIPHDLSCKGCMTTKDGYNVLPSGVEYKIYKHGTGTKKPMIGDHVTMHIKVHVKDSVIFDSRKMNNNTAVPFDMQPPKFKGDPVEGFMMLVAGDSAVIRIAVDSLKKAGNQLLPWMKEGDKIVENVVLVSIQSPQEKKRDDSIKAAIQKSIDDNLLQQYFKMHNITPMKTETGIYYTISKEGTGTVAKDGYNASINYTGKLMNGKVFDSNTDTSFHHVEPLKVEIGKGRVIKGWDQGLKLLKKGSVATLYIPSTLAYGSTDRPNIPANSIMIFDMEVVDLYNQTEKDDELIQKYIKDHDLKAEKTASGLYYVVKKEGNGEYAKDGMNMSMNYVGKLLDGKTFDTNTDTAFHHAEPFNFEIGKGKVIKGWDEGLTHFKKGGKGLLLIPSGLAYGAQNRSPSIPPNSVLVFDVEVLDCYNQAEMEEKKIKKYLKDNNINAKRTESGLYYTIKKEGIGEHPKAGQTVFVNYTGMTLNGTKFDSNMDTAFHHVEPFKFSLGQSQVIKGWDEGIALLKKNGTATLFIPSTMAYGAQSPTSAIPPNSILIFDVELVDFQQ